MNAIASGLRADIDHGIAFTRRARVEDFVLPHEAKRKCIHQRIARVTRLKFRLPTKIRYTETVAVRSNTANHPFKNRVVLVNLALRGNSLCGKSFCGDSRPRLSVRAKPGSLRRNWSKPERIHHRHGPRPHGENVPQDPPHSRGRALKGLNKRRVIMRLNLERASPAISNVDDPRILSRPLHNQPAARRQALEMHARRLVGAVLAPHHAEDAEFGNSRLASPEKLFDFFVLVRREPVLPESLRGEGSSQGGGGGHGR